MYSIFVTVVVTLSASPPPISVSTQLMGQYHSLDQCAQVANKIQSKGGFEMNRTVYRQTLAQCVQVKDKP